MSKKIMIQGTMSNVGKSVLAAGLCRLFTNDGFRVKPFKSQNMSSFGVMTPYGEMAGAQITQARGCRVDPHPDMNPVLMKPAGQRHSKIIFRGKPLTEYGKEDALYSGTEYYALRPGLIPGILEAAKNLQKDADILVIEGAGGCAEINLREGDVVNMGLAHMLDAPVILVGDIEPGGVFAQLYGSYMLLDEADRDLIKGFIINKFRGDASILESGLRLLEEKCGIPVLGVLPWFDVGLPDEDSFSISKRKDDDKNSENWDYAGFDMDQGLDRAADMLRRYVDVEGIYRIIDGHYGTVRDE